MFNRNRKNYTTVGKLAHSLKLLARLTDIKNNSLPEEDYGLLTKIFRQNRISEHRVGLSNNQKIESVSTASSRHLKIREGCRYMSKLHHHATD